MVLHFLSVAIGGACGAMARYAAALYIAGQFGAASWVATLSVNIAGSFLMGAIAGFIAITPTIAEPLRLAISVGFLGALTTFSTYALDSYTLFQRGEMVVLFGYVIGSVVLSLIAFGAGMMLIRQIMLP